MTTFCPAASAVVTATDERERAGPRLEVVQERGQPVDIHLAILAAGRGGTLPPMTGPLGRRPRDAWLATISNRNG